MDRDITARLAEFSLGRITTSEREKQAIAQILRASLAHAELSEGDRSVVGALEKVAVRMTEASDEARVWRSQLRLQAEWASFLNAFLLSSESHGRPSFEAAVIPAAAAVAELMNASALELSEAVLIGLEVAERVKRGLGRTHEERGWDLTGTAGVVASSVVAARLLGLTRDQAEQAIGLATTQIAGLLVQEGTDAIALHAAKATFNGVEASRLVAHGLDGPKAIIEGRRGLFALASDDPEPESVTNGLGERWVFHDAVGTDHSTPSASAWSRFFDPKVTARAALDQAMVS